jgi:hypothetical protein
MHFVFCFLSLLIRHRIVKLLTPSSEADECIHDFTFLWPDHRGRYKSWPQIFTDYVWRWKWHSCCSRLYFTFMWGRSEVLKQEYGWLGTLEVNGRAKLRDAKGYNVATAFYNVASRHLFEFCVTWWKRNLDVGGGLNEGELTGQDRIGLEMHFDSPGGF